MTNDSAKPALTIPPDGDPWRLGRIRAESQCLAVVDWQGHLLHHGSCFGLPWEAIAMAFSSSLSALHGTMYSALHGETLWPLHTLSSGDYLCLATVRSTGSVRQLAESVAEAGWWVLKDDHDGEDRMLGSYVYASVTLTTPLACPDHGVLA